MCPKLFIGTCHSRFPHRKLLDDQNGEITSIQQSLPIPSRCWPHLEPCGNEWSKEFGRAGLGYLLPRSRLLGLTSRLLRMHVYHGFHRGRTCLQYRALLGSFCDFLVGNPHFAPVARCHGLWHRAIGEVEVGTPSELEAPAFVRR